MKELPKAFEAKQYEDAVYKRWEDSGFFNPDVCVQKGVTHPTANPFTVVLPPPNVTGTLHMGHASMLAIEDLMVRYHRMKGDKTLWLPGTDHAAVATESKVEGLLIKEENMKKPKEELGRESFLERVRQFAQASHDTIVNQSKKMGSSLDWSREAFTLDEPRNLAVRTMFKKMYDDGLIYRGYRVVNWSVKGQSTCSDDELVYVDRPAKLYTFTYGPECPIAISTTRPETKLGDTAIAVHPDGKWKQYIGQIFTIANFGEKGHTLTLKVIGSTEVDDNFGTGALGVTPAHSMVDFDMYQKEKREGNAIELIPVIGEDGRMTKEAGESYQGLLVHEARERIVVWLKEQHLITNEEDITQSAGTSDRFGDVVEPLPKVQWFVNVTKPFRMGPSFIPTINEGDMVTLKQLMQTVVRGGAIQIIPERFAKTYFYWIDNLRDWCISRQIWYGHQIPVWYKGEEIYCGMEAPQGEGWAQDPDTLDTWFSSGLWTFSTLGWPLTTIHFVRHGEAENNIDNIVSDDEGSAFPLTKKGETQVKELAVTLKGKKIDHIIASPILRTKQTAEILAKELGVPLTFDSRLREVGVGELNGATEEALEQARADHGWMVKTPYAIESYTSLHGRTKEFLNETLHAYRGKEILIVSHGDTLAALKQFGTKEYTPEFGLIQGRATDDTRTFDANDMQSNDFATFHPTSVLETGYDILPFWVARMILMTTYALGDVPFHTVYLHGLVRDAEGRKMSKSLGNIINPLDMIDKYGTDATRLSLLIGGTPGNDMKLSEEKIAGFRNFTNKIWNIARFMLLNIENPAASVLRPKAETETDSWVLAELDTVIETYTSLLDRYEYSAAGELLRSFTYDTLADWYLELAKLEGKKDDLYNYVLNTLLKLWHPFMPFVTETIWHEVYGDSAYLLVERWPQAFEKVTKKKESIVTSVQKVVLALRQLKSDYRIAKAEEGAIVPDGIASKALTAYLPHIERMGGVAVCTIAKEIPEGMVHAVVQGVGTVALSVKGQVDTQKEKARIQKEIDTVAPYIKTLTAKLANEGFVAKAPPAVLEGEKKKLAEAEEKLAKLTHQLTTL